MNLKDSFKGTQAVAVFVNQVNNYESLIKGLQYYRDHIESANTSLSFISNLQDTSCDIVYDVSTDNQYPKQKTFTYNF